MAICLTPFFPKSMKKLIDSDVRDELLNSLSDKERFAYKPKKCGGWMFPRYRGEVSKGG